MAPNLILYFLQASRCIRKAWQLGESRLDYKLDFADRGNGIAPRHFRGNSGQVSIAQGRDIDFLESELARGDDSSWWVVR